MPRENVIRLVAFVIAMVGITLFIFTDDHVLQRTQANNTNPPLSHTGAPISGGSPELGCTACHTSAPTGDSFTISGGGAGNTYTPGQTYTITVSHTLVGLWGFEITALNGSFAAAGTLSSPDATTTTKCATPTSLNVYPTGFTPPCLAGERYYTFHSARSASNFSFQWTAPATDVGAVTFYASGVRGGGDATASNDPGYFATRVLTAAQPPGTLQFSAASYSQSENGGTATITVTRTGGSSGAASVQFSNPAGGTATGGASCSAGVDYITPSGTLNWADGDATNKTFAVTICNDTIFESNETVNLALSNATGATLGAQTSATLTITNDDSQPSISINDVSQSEGNSGTTSFTFTVSLSNPTTQTVTVTYATANGTATTADNDYQAVGATVLTFNPLEVSKNVTVLVNGDTTFEPNETFFVNLTSPGNATISDAQGQGTIVNDDPAPQPGTLQFSTASYSQSENGGTATITVTRTGGSSGAASVQFSNPAGGTATGGASCSAGVDYITPSGTLNWADGDATNKTFAVTICNDTIFESNETVNLALSNATGATLGAQTSATLTITNDDSQPSISINDVSQSEGNSGTTSFTFTVSLSNPTTQTVTVTYATANGTATTADNDYQAVGATVLTFNPLEVSKNVTVLVNGDTTFEPDETFFVNLTSPGNATISDAQGQGTIVNDDGAPQPGTLQFSTASYSQSENGGTATITVTRTGGSSGAASVQFSNPAGGTATGGASCSAGVDYVTPSGTLNWADGDAANKTFAVTICNDTIFEGNETVNLALSNATGATLGAQTSATLTITDDDSQPSLSINDVSQNEGNSGTTSFTFTVSLSNPTTQTVTVTYATANGTATTADNDYQAVGATMLTFNPLEVSKNVTVLVNGDVTSEPDETFFVNLTNPTNANISDGQGQGTIINDDPGSQPSTIQLSASNYSANEDAGSLTVTVTRAGDSSGAASVDYATSDTASINCGAVGGLASSRCDYLTKLGTLSFAAGETSKTVSVLIIDDAYAEGSENFTFTLSNATGATLGSTTAATLTINDNDAVNGTNPIDTASFFVRQHYLDFLNREPDTGGFNFWTNEITSCGTDAQCIEVKRINVSAAFFLSIEFQETGYLVYRMYKSGFGNLPGAPVPVRFKNFLRDTQQIGQGVQVGIGDWQTQLEANKQAFALAFVQRTEFQAAFPNTMTADEFVTKLDTNAGGVLSATEKADLIALLGSTPSDVSKRAQVLRAVADDSDLRSAEFNKAFVLMQYFGYLRRNPDDAPDVDFSGYNFWLNKLNSFGGNFVNAEMVKAFIISGEYRQRFGP